MNENGTDAGRNEGNESGKLRTPEPRTLSRNIPALYAWSSVRNCFFSIPVIVLFWQDNGLSISQVTFLQSLFALFVVVLEIPSGYLADLFGRSRLLTLSAFMQTAGIIVYSLGTDFSSFLVAEGLFAIGISMSSGADSAFVFDTLKALGKEETYAKVLGRNHFLELIVLGISNALGGFLARYDLRLTLVLSIPFFAFAVPVSLLFREPPVHSRLSEKSGPPSLSLIRDTVVKNRNVRNIIVFGAVLAAFNNGALWLYQPYFALSNLPLWSFGLIFASFHIVAAVSAQAAGRLLEKTGFMPLMILLMTASLGAYFLMGAVIMPFSFLFVFMQQWVRGTQYVVFSDAVNRETDSSVRATVLSVQNLVSRLGYSAVLPIIGMTADSTSIPRALLYAGAAGTFLCTLAFVPIAVRRKRAENEVRAY